MDKMVFEQAEQLINLADVRFYVAGDTLIQGSPYLPLSCVSKGMPRSSMGLTYD